MIIDDDPHFELFAYSNPKIAAIYTKNIERKRKRERRQVSPRLVALNPISHLSSSPSPAVSAFAFFILHRDHSYYHRKLSPRNFHGTYGSKCRAVVARPGRVNQEIAVPLCIYPDSRVFTSVIALLPFSFPLAPIFIEFLSAFHVRGKSLYFSHLAKLHRSNIRAALAPVSIFSQGEAETLPSNFPKNVKIRHS